MTYTAHYGLKKLNVGEVISDDSYKFSDADRDTEDLLLYLGAEGHRHTGGGGTNATPVDAPTLAVNTTSGILPAGRRIFYKYTLVDPTGGESGASPEAFVDTPAQVTPPAKPTLSSAATGGVLLPGNYYYVLSAYTGTVGSNFETQALNPEYLFVEGVTSTNRVTITLPALPSGAQGFNVYRQAPNGPGYFYIASIDMTGGSPPTTYSDDGTVEPNCDRTRPTTNSTRQTNAVILSLPTTLPAGWQWRAYRTFIVNDYANSLLTTSGTSPITDTGAPTTFGQPPVQGVSVGSPAKLLLTDAIETQGRAPMSAISAFPYILNFSLLGEVFVLQGSNVWICEFPKATIIGVRAALGRGLVPVGQDIIIDVNVGSGLNPTMTSIFANQGSQPKILVNNQIGNRVVPNADAELVAGDVLTIDVDQTGGSTAANLVVAVYMYVYGWTSNISHVGV
jgi:hypothetical protein